MAITEGPLLRWEVAWAARKDTESGAGVCAGERAASRWWRDQFDPGCRQLQRQRQAVQGLHRSSQRHARYRRSSKKFGPGRLSPLHEECQRRIVQELSTGGSK